MPKKLKVDLHIHTAEETLEPTRYSAFELIDAASDSVGVAVTVAQQLPAGLADTLVGIAK